MWLGICLLAIATLVIIGILIPRTTIADKSEAQVIPKSPLDVLTNNSSKDEIIMAIRYVSVKYGVNESEMMTTIKCESTFYHNQYGDNGLAYGIAQFHKPTFDRFCSGDYKSLKDQLNCMGQMFQKKLQGHWTCYKKYFGT